ncbi:ABC transporter substrate-binding protein [Salinicoccus kekensis]|uniref:Iron complex transport system substrate-binding protein n=1 Tax=Salinicoccus kekensis TaxID=714307 RepID=A0A285U7R1_9STAP|nr:ABC transporter substrate-binding protein [Salinicoccus kekensis]SOC37753.1 iron complex transport system substrate-binding protein [Salinicoccus kekensis]
MNRFGLLFAGIIFASLLAACGGEATGDDDGGTAEMREYTTDAGETIEIPAEPERIVVMASSYFGNFKHLDANMVGAHTVVTQSEVLEPMTEDVEMIEEGNIEQIMNLDPDLIIAFETDENLEKYETVAPTIPVQYEKWNYLDIHEEFGSITGNEEAASEWMAEWESKLAEDRAAVEEAVGTDVSASVIEQYAKDIYVYGTNWGRGTEIIYQELGLDVPEAVEADVVETGWKNISAEEIDKYAGDFMFVGTGDSGADNAYRDTNVWKELDAVQNNRVIEFDSPTFYYNDPYSLEHQREFIVDALTE